MSSPPKRQKTSHDGAAEVSTAANDQPGYDFYAKIANHLKANTEYRPDIFIVCGTGLGDLAKLIEEPVSFEYKDIPGFPVSTVQGHAGRLIFGKLQGKVVGCMQGRFHSYEGYPMWKVTCPVRVMKLLGASIMIVTNAAGGINSNYSVGDIMLMQDHINFPGMAGRHPLVGANLPEFGPRFHSMTKAYDRGLYALAESAVKELGFDSFVQKGVYACVSGPSYETPSELKFLLGGGADVVGMSTAPEVTVATHCGMRCLGFSLVTNECVTNFESTDEPNHEEVIEAGRARAVDMQKLVSLIVSKMEVAVSK